MNYADTDQDHPFELEDNETFSGMVHKLGLWDPSTTIGEAVALFSVAPLLSQPWKSVVELLAYNTGMFETDADKLLGKLREKRLVEREPDSTTHLTEEAITLLMRATEDDGWEYDHLGDPFNDDWLGSPEDLIDARVEWVMRKNRGL